MVIASTQAADICLPRFSVDFEYPVYFTEQVFDPRNPTLRDALCRREPARRHRFVVVIDSGVAITWPQLMDQIWRYADRHRAHLDLAAPPLQMSGGETIKNDPDAPLRLQSWLHRHRIDRQSFVVIVGGGALLDTAGFAAATAHRGVRVVRMPTTVLAQNDSGIGVKNGVNAFGAKNYLGTFAPPFAVINDGAFLETLELRDRVAGIAEAVKVACIRDDAFFGWLESQAEALTALSPASTRTMVRRCAELHLAHITGAGDPFEFGSARPLDFGHWAAHRLETLTHHRLRHGEAVAIGMAIDALYSVETGLLDSVSAQRLIDLLRRLGFALWDEVLDRRAGSGQRSIMSGLADFREHLGGELSVTMLRAIGRPVEVHEIAEPAVERALQRLHGVAG